MYEMPDGGGEEVGIDPAKLAALISALSKNAANGSSLVSLYTGKAARCGVDTSRLTKAAQDLSWATDQLPMLNRRQSMAQAMERQDPGLGPMVSAGAGYLGFPTDGAAQKAGSSDGSKAAQALTEHSNDDFIASDLAAHADDPAYLAAFFAALGPQGLAQLGLQVSGYKQSGDTGKYDGWAGLVGDGLATASYRMPFSESWLNDIKLPESGATQPELDLIQPFLSRGVYSPDWLKPLGQYALNEAYLEGAEPGMTPPPSLDGIWEAIAHNPAYDAQFYHDNFPSSELPGRSLSELMSNPMLTHSVLDGAFADMVKSATIPPDPTQFPGQSPAAYAHNAQLTVKYFGENGDARTSDDVRKVFGAIAMNYFGDLASSVRAAAPGMGAGDSVPGWQISATAGQWGNFVTEAMRDKTTSAQLLTFYSGWVKATQPPDWRGRGNENVPDHQGFWNDFSLGVMDDFMASTYQAAGAQAGDSSSEIADVAAAGGSAFLTSLVFGPEAGVADLVLEGVKEGFKTGTEGMLKDAFDGDPKKPDSPDAALQQLTGVPDTYSNEVHRWWGPGQPPMDPVQYQGHSYTGDPSTYIQQYSTPGHSADFVHRDGPKAGQLMDPDTDHMNSQQLAAYNAWLQDPAVVNANAAAVRAAELGKVSSYYSRSFPGSG